MSTGPSAIFTLPSPISETLTLRASKVSLESLGCATMFEALVMYSNSVQGACETTVIDTEIMCLLRNTGDGEQEKKEEQHPPQERA